MRVLSVLLWPVSIAQRISGENRYCKCRYCKCRYRKCHKERCPALKEGQPVPLHRMHPTSMRAAAAELFSRSHESGEPVEDN